MKINSRQRKIITVIALAIFALNANAQKQPQIQDASVWAPANVKIDGREDEWPNPMYNPKKTDGFLQAYNSTSRIYYTVANDDKNLYFIVRGLGTRVIMKTLSGGMTFTISHATEKKQRAKATDNVVITFPMPVEDKDISVAMGPIWGGTDFYNEPEYYPADYKFLKQMDSIQVISNAKLGPLIKEIGVKGIKEIPDSVISVYNEQGIKAMMQFTWRQPTYEIAIPLKYLGLDAASATKISYNIKLNIRDMRTLKPPPPPVGAVQFAAPIVVMGGGGSFQPDPGTLFMLEATDFWGEYTLAKKP